MFGITFSLLDPIMNLTIQTEEFARRYVVLQGCSWCVTVATSVLATFVIGVEIYSSTRLDSRARRRYKYVIEIIIQSAGLYTLSILALAITFLIGAGDFDLGGPAIINASNYAYTIAAITPAFATTLMVARLELSKEKADDGFSTSMKSETRDTMLSDFVADPRPISGENEDVVWE